MSTATTLLWKGVPGEPLEDGTAPPEPAIRVDHLNHYYGAGELRRQVLFDNTLEMYPGEIVIMTGPSGSGKTTLLTLIGGLRSVQTGSLQVLGHELHGASRDDLIAVRRKLGFIFQAHNLFESLTAFQNVRMALELFPGSSAERASKVVSMLTAVGLEKQIERKPARLSGGQRQRVAVARALVHGPRIVLADEPTAALDEHSGRTVVNLLKAMAQEHACTVLIVTHDNRILDVADRIVNMVDGRIRSNVVVRESQLICEFLRDVSPFKELTPQALSEVADRMRVERQPAGHVVIRQGDTGDKFYLIRQGAVDVLVDSGRGPRTVATLGAGQFFGERALVTGEPRNATVIARQTSLFYVLDKDDFRATMDSHASFQKELRSVLFSRQ